MGTREAGLLNGVDPQTSAKGRVQKVGTTDLGSYVKKNNLQRWTHLVGVIMCQKIVIVEAVKVGVNRWKWNLSILLSVGFL